MLESMEVGFFVPVAGAKRKSTGSMSRMREKNREPSLFCVCLAGRLFLGCDPYVCRGNCLWEVQIPSVAFKNVASSFFGSKPFRLVLPNLAGLYEMIDAYRDGHRARLIGMLRIRAPSS